jgi:RNA polymerase sigma-70 factor (ECF subfamily)
MPSAPSSQRPRAARAVDASLEGAQPADSGDEPAIVQAARNGDRAAFALLYERYAPMVHGIALSRVSPSEADDVTQEAFMLAIDRLPTLRAANAFGPWLATIVRNLAVEFYRRKASRPHLGLSEQATSDTDSQSQQRIEQARRLLSVIRSLPASYAETLVLRLVEGLSGPQIAACTGLTHGSVRVNLNRGMALLRERLRAMSIDLEDSP